MSKIVNQILNGKPIRKAICEGANDTGPVEFKSLNVDGKERKWKFNTVGELENEWLSDFPDLPANDDPIWDVKLAGKKMIPKATHETAMGEDPVWFEDMLGAFKIIW